jgi:hypothetical protein
MSEESKEPEVVGEETSEIDVEFTTREEYIGCAYSALMAIGDLDSGLMNKVNQNRVKRIRRMCLRILDDCVKEMHDELFETEEED